MNALKRTFLIKELEKWLSDQKIIFEKEIPFKSIMETSRRFRADYFIDESFHGRPAFIIEINGGQWTSGRHNRGGKGYENDLCKLNLAQSEGIRIFQFTYEMLERQEYKDYLP